MRKLHHCKNLFIYLSQPGAKTQEFIYLFIVDVRGVKRRVHFLRVEGALCSYPRSDTCVYFMPPCQRAPPRDQGFLARSPPPSIRPAGSAA